MSYEHQWHLSMPFPQDVDREALHRAFRPLLAYFGHPWADPAAGAFADVSDPTGIREGSLITHQCEITWSSDGSSCARPGPVGSVTLTIDTSGPVSHDFADLVRSCLRDASALTPHRGCAPLWDVETGNLEHALTRLAFGPTARARRLAQAEAVLGQAEHDLLALLPAPSFPDDAASDIHVALEVVLQSLMRTIEQGDATPNSDPRPSP